jgi:molybdate transport repressor ModE-like protein
MNAAPHAALDWNDLQVFLAVARQGSVGAAARHLGINHSTVLRRVASLEAVLGARLFDRLPGGYTPTAAGELLAESLAGLDDQVDAAQRQLAGGDAEIKGSIRLTTTDTLVHGLLMPHLVAFQAQHPQIELELVANNALLNLTQREADVAVRGTNHPPENLIGRRVGRIQTALYAAPAYLEALQAGEPAREVINDIQWPGHRWVAPSATLSHLEQAKWVREHVPPERVVVRVDSLVAMVQAVQHGMGLGWLLCPLAKQAGALVQMAAPLPEAATDIWVLTHPQLKSVQRMRVFADFLAERLRSDPLLSHD